MHARLSIDAMCTFPWTFDQDLALWSDMSVPYAGLLISKLADEPQTCMDRLSAAEIRASTLITEAFDLSAPETWDRTRAAHHEALDLMAQFGGRSIYFTPGRTTGAQWREDLDLFAEAVAPTVAYARGVGVLAAIEPSLRTSVSFVNTLRDAIDVSERTGIGIVADFGNMWMERDFDLIVARAMPHIALMQFGDVVIGGPGRAAPGGRVHIGEGELPLHRMMHDVLNAGYEGPFDLEVVPADFSMGSDEATLRRGITAASALLVELGI